MGGAARDLIHWIPVAAVRVVGGAVVTANEAATALLEDPSTLLGDLAEADRAALLAAVAAAVGPAAADTPAADTPAAVGSPLTVCLGSEPPHLFLEVTVGRHPEGGALVLLVDVTERERLDATIAEFATGVYVTDADLRALWIPDRVSESVGLPRDRFEGSAVAEMVHPDDRDLVWKMADRARALPGVRCSCSVRVNQMDLPDVWWPIVVHAIWRGDDPAIGGLLVRFDLDPTAGVDLQGADAGAQAVVTLAPSSTTGALHLGLDLELRQRSTRVREILRPVGDDADRRWFELLRPSDRPAISGRIEAALVGDLLPPVEVAFVGGGSAVWARVDALAYRDTEGRVAGLFVNIADVTAEREARDELAVAREELWQMANHDPLTGLANRNRLGEELDRTLAAASFADGSARPAVVVADLDRFKEVNDVHGHRVGDEVLVEAARRLVGATGSDDLVCRFGGDEFVVLYPSVTGAADLEARAERLAEAFAEPITVDDRQFEIGVSAAGSIAEPADAASPDGLILRADRAMYAAKVARRPVTG